MQGGFAFLTCTIMQCTSIHNHVMQFMMITITKECACVQGLLCMYVFMHVLVGYL